MTETVKNRIMIVGPKAAGGKAARADGRSWVACRAGLGVARLCDAPGEWSRQYRILGLPSP
jgi:hypothetical protein